MTPAARLVDMLLPAVRAGLKVAQRKFAAPTVEDYAEEIAAAFELELERDRSRPPE